MDDIQNLTDQELQRLFNELKEVKGPIGSWFEKKRIERRTEINSYASQEMFSLLMREAMSEAVDDYRQRRLREKSMEAIRAQTASMEERNRQARLQDELEAIQFKKFERAVQAKLMERAAQYGLDVPTYLEVIKALIIGDGQDSELKGLIENITANIKLEAFQSHMELDMLRKELAGLYRQEVILENSPDSPVKEKELKDLHSQIKTYQKDKKDREDRLVKKDSRKKSSGYEAPSDPDLRTGTKNDNEQK